MSTAAETERKYPLDEIVYALVSDLSTNDWNPRKLTAERFESLKKSIRDDPDGMKDRPLIALPDGTVIAGNMRLEASRALSIERVPTVFHDFGPEKARIVALRDNNSWGEWDDQGVAEMLYQLDQAEVDLELSGFSTDELKLFMDAFSPEGPPKDDRGTDLSLADVSIGDPTRKVERGQVWKVGAHVLVCASVYDGWPAWIGFLEDEDVLFVPYPTPTLPLTSRAEESRLVMVQPDPWLAGHLLDKFAAVRGEDAVSILD